MKKKEKTFMEKCISGKCAVNDIDKYVEYWHNNETNNSLQEFLGLTYTQYVDWLFEGNDVINKIVQETKNNKRK